MRSVAWLLLCACAPMVAGPGRVLPVALQYEPDVYGVKVEPLPRREVHRLTPSALTVLWVEDHVVPLVDVRLVAHCGLLDAPAGQPDALGVAWGTAFDLTRLQGLGAHPRVEVRPTLSSLSFSVARPNLEAALALVAEGLVSPHLDADDLALELNLVRASREGRVELARRQASEALLRAGYGHVPGLVTPVAPLAISVELVRSTWARCGAAANLVWTFAGDVDEASVRAAMRPVDALPPSARLERSWPRAESKPGVWLAPNEVDAGTVLSLCGDGFRPGTDSGPAAEFALSLVVPHLSRDLRHRSGLTYAVTPSLTLDEAGGLACVSLTVAPEQTATAVEVLFRVFDLFWNDWPIPFMDMGLYKQRARRSAQSEAWAAGEVAAVEGPRWDAKRLDARYRQLTNADGVSAFRQMFDPARRRLVVSGRLDASLDWSRWGPVTVIRDLQRRRPRADAVDGASGGVGVGLMAR